MRLCFIDTETTSLDAKTNSIVQLAGVFVEENGEEFPFSFKMRPFRGDHMSKEATRKTGITDEMAYSYEDPKECFDKFIEFLDSHIDNRNWADRVYFVGYNVKFDEDFVRELFLFFGNNNFGRYFISPSIDVMTLAGFFLRDRRQNIYKFTLSNVYKEMFGKFFEDAHSAYSDILATRDIYNLILREYIPSAPVKKEEDTVKTLLPVRKKKIV